MAPNSNNTDAVRCGICLEPMDERVAALDGCIHRFCFECIFQWAQVTNRCPFCKRKFRKLVTSKMDDDSTSSSQEISIEDREQLPIDNYEDEATWFSEISGRVLRMTRSRARRLRGQVTHADSSNVSHKQIVPIDVDKENIEVPSSAEIRTVSNGSSTTTTTTASTAEPAKQNKLRSFISTGQLSIPHYFAQLPVPSGESTKSNMRRSKGKLQPKPFSNVPPKRPIRSKKAIEIMDDAIEELPTSPVKKLRTAFHDLTNDARPVSPISPWIKPNNSSTATKDGTDSSQLLLNAPSSPPDLTRLFSEPNSPYKTPRLSTSKPSQNNRQRGSQEQKCQDQELLQDHTTGVQWCALGKSCREEYQTDMETFLITQKKDMHILHTSLNVRTLLQPYYAHKQLSEHDFQDIAKRVTLDFVDSLEITELDKPVCLSPSRKNRLEIMLGQELMNIGLT